MNKSLILINKIVLLICVSYAGLAAAAQVAVPAAWWPDINNNRTADIETMLNAGANPNALDSQREPSIMLAVRHKAWGVFDALAADPKTDVNIVNRLDETPLMYLAIVGQTDRARALIRRGAKVNRLGWTPLHYAASTGKVETAKMLLTHKAIVNAPSPDGTTPLMMAALSGSKAMVQLLLDHGADVTTRNLKGQSAADWARAKGHAELADELHALSEKVIALRQAQRERDIANRGGEGRTHEPSIDSALPVLKLESTRPSSAPPSVSAPAAAPEAPSHSNGNGTSRYFNSGDTRTAPGN